MALTTQSVRLEYIRKLASLLGDPSTPQQPLCDRIERLLAEAMEREAKASEDLTSEREMSHE